MKLGFVTCHFPPDSIGGGQVQSLRLCEALSKTHKVVVFTRAYNKQLPLQEKIGDFTIQRRRVVNLAIFRSVVDFVKVLFQIKKYKKEIKIYISFHLQLASLMVIVAKILFGTKAFVSPRGFEDFDFKGFKKHFQKFIYKRADIILIQSDKIKDAFCSQLERNFSLKKQNDIKRKIRVFPNGITVPPVLPKKVSERPNEILFVGRLEPIKGVSTLLEAFRQCNQNLHLKIIGEGSQRNYLESLAKGLNVSFLGLCDEVEIKQHLESSKALILPSLSENFPNVILEAFCAGIPVIASNVGAIPELIEDGINGFLVPPTRTAELSEKINLLFVSDDRLNEMGMMSYQKVRVYDWPDLVERFNSIVAN